MGIDIFINTFSNIVPLYHIELIIYELHNNLVQNKILWNIIWYRT